MNSAIEEHLDYLSESFRLPRYRAAIQDRLRRGDAVVDLGCGTGVLGLLALQAGAGRVYAIDSTAALSLAEQSIRALGYGPDRWIPIRSRSEHAILPERVDFVICDQVGYFGFDYGIVGQLRDARRRFLRPDGICIPSRLRLHVAAVGSPAARKQADAWATPPVPDAFHWLRAMAIEHKYPVRLDSEDVLGTTALGEIALGEEGPDFFTWAVDLPIERDGALHGLAGWFDCELAPGVWMTNSPRSDEALQRPQAFLPVAQTPPLKAGETLHVQVMARPDDHVIAWRIQLPDGEVLQHSTFAGELLSHETLKRRDPNYIPLLGARERARQTVLSYCDGNRSVAQIEKAILADHPTLLPSTEAIRRFIARILHDA